eukprot:9525363-Heterocapsa_arctica.AAC.1
MRRRLAPRSGEAAAERQTSTADKRDRRFYAVWCVPDNCADLKGVHAGVGVAAYEKICAEAGGFGGALRWRRFDAVQEAFNAYWDQARTRDAPLPLLRVAMTRPLPA